MSKLNLLFGVLKWILFGYIFSNYSSLQILFFKHDWLQYLLRKYHLYFMCSGILSGCGDKKVQYMLGLPERLFDVQRLQHLLPMRLSVLPERHLEQVRLLLQCQQLSLLQLFFLLSGLCPRVLRKRKRRMHSMQQKLHQLHQRFVLLPM